jgi:hypothetical protein
MNPVHDNFIRYPNCTLKSINNGSCRLIVNYNDKRPIKLELSSRLLPPGVKEGDRLEYIIQKKNEEYIGKIQTPGVFEKQ